jgi:hypothetical protein
MLIAQPSKHHRRNSVAALASWPRTLSRALAPPTALLAAAVAAGACADLAPKGDGKPLAILVDVADVSGSGDIATRCAEVSARIRSIVDDPRTRNLDLLVLATGGASGEPSALVPWTTYQPFAGLYEAPEHSARHRAEWIAGVERTCAARLRPSNVSPVYEAVRRALEAIEARCADRAKERFRCARKMLAVQSDFRSTHGEFGAHLCGLAAKCRAKKALPDSLRLEPGDVELSFCGVSNTDAGDGLSAELVQKAWSDAFGRPLVINPVCPSSATADGASA